MRTRQWIEVRTRTWTRTLVGAVLLATVAQGTVAQGQVWEVGNQLLQPAAPQGGANFGLALAVGDFNGDDISDLAVGEPDRDRAGKFDVGRVSVYLGSPAGLVFARHLGFDSLDESSRFGAALVAGSFEDDLATRGGPVDATLELAVGAPGSSGWGEVYLFFEPHELPSYTSFVHPESRRAGDLFGAALAVGDFDGDDLQDLAVGAPSMDVGTTTVEPDEGGVAVFRGLGTNLGSGVSLHDPVPQSGADFGAALAAGRFDGGSYDDLAVGSPGRTVVQSNAGQVLVLQGTAAGPTTAGAQRIDRSVLTGNITSTDELGIALAAGDFDREPCFCTFYDDLAIGVPGSDLTVSNGGQVLVLTGSATGLLTGASTRVLEQSNLSASETPTETNDFFGFSLASGRLDAGNSSWDLAVGTLNEAVTTQSFQGLAHLVFGDGGGIDQGPPAQTIWARPGLASQPPEAGDYFGRAIAFGDFDGDGWGDVALGIPGDDVGGVSSGSVQILYGALFADGFERGGTGAW